MGEAMGEAIVVNLFLTARVLLVGGFLLILPRITRKGLLFGTYVGEASVDREAARRLLSEWSRGCVFLMVLSLLIGYVLLTRSLEYLDYYVFTSQPITSERKRSVGFSASAGDGESM